MPEHLKPIQSVDSHTAGEPTRVIVAGGPDLRGGSVAEQLAVLRREHDWLRSAAVCEPRGSDVLVGALLTEPADPSCLAGVVFFNNVGYLGMCGHGTIGVIATLAHRASLPPAEYRLETPVGVVTTRLHSDGAVSVRNVPSYRLAKAVRVEVEGHGLVTGDVAWGGNWFFLTEDHGQELRLEDAESLTAFAWRVRRALREQGTAGSAGEEIDHIELFGPPWTPGAHSRNFVLCPGGAYDRSPCGTGTSAKIACLAADGKLQPGEVWRQESLIGSVFEATYEWGEDGRVLPTITGRAFITAESCLYLDPEDPFRFGIRAR
jgi:4-hydroxyproline epimerase